MDVSWHIRDIHLLKGISPEELEKIFDITHTMTYDRGEILFHPEEHPRRLYFLHHGRVKSYTITPDGDLQILQIFHPGDAFGGLLMGVAEGVPIWAEAHDQVVATMMDEFCFKDFMRMTPNICFKLFQYMANHHAHDIIRLQKLIHCDAKTRLIIVLLHLVRVNEHPDEDWIEVYPPYTHADLANMIGVARTTVSEIISDLKTEEVLKGRGRQLLINKYAALELARSNEIGEI